MVLQIIMHAVLYLVIHLLIDYGGTEVFYELIESLPFTSN